MKSKVQTMAISVAALLLSCSAWAGTFQPQDVTIPIPSGLGAPMGKLMVVGTPGAGQSDTFSYTYCDTDANGALVAFGCQDLKKHHLNKPLDLPAGTYRVVYSDTTAVIQVAGDKTTTENLQRINVPPGRNVQFNVFSDYTDASMQDLVIQDIWSNGANRDLEKQYCPSKNKKIEAMCKAYASGNYRSMLNAVIAFGQDGSYSTFTTAGLMNQGRNYVADPKAGQFLSVLPGVYGIVFTDPVTGKKVTQYGIKVQ